jgi:hypothetical protein
LPYRAPGDADNVGQAVLAAWNATIAHEFDSVLAGHAEAEPCLLRDPAQIRGGVVTDAVHWPGDPAEPRFCQSREWAEKLSDWGVRGRHLFHNEYFEYGLVFRVDAAGRMRPKRVVATTELPEYWLTVATVDPNQLQRMGEDALGWRPSSVISMARRASTPAG